MRFFVKKLAFVENMSRFLAKCVILQDTESNVFVATQRDLILYQVTIFAFFDHEQCHFFLLRDERKERERARARALVKRKEEKGVGF